jgi:hypothetical protein
VVELFEEPVRDLLSFLVAEPNAISQKNTMKHLIQREKETRMAFLAGGLGSSQRSAARHVHNAKEPGQRRPAAGFHSILI